MAQHYSLNISNSVGGSNRGPILVTSEYHHWSERIKRYLRRLRKEIWRSIEEGPHVLVLTPITHKTHIRQGGGATMTRPTNNDIDKMEKDEITYHEIPFGVPPDTYDLIIKYEATMKITLRF